MPIRFVSEALGAKVDWDAATRRVAIKDGGKVIVLTLGVPSALVNGQTTAIDCAPATMPPGRTFVPLRFVSETLGAVVDYDPVTRQITITR
ncbi:MAG: copper amine oxidase N-terminal domain-containing protein [Bacillota bacterium]